MKKLIIVATIALAAFVGNAASMTWASGAIGIAPTGSGTATGANTTAKLFVLTASQYSDLETAVAGKSAADISTYIYNNYKDGTSAATASWSKGSASLKDSATYNAGDTAYAVVLYTQTIDEKEYYIGNYGSWTFAAAQNKTVANMGKNLNGLTTGDAMSWGPQGVPEPTSGILMLVGLGALALRRRKA